MAIPVQNYKRKARPKAAPMAKKVAAPPQVSSSASKKVAQPAFVPKKGLSEAESREITRKQYSIEPEIELLPFTPDCIYKGKEIDGKRHGQGKIAFPAGDFYDGGFFEGLY